MASELISNVLRHTPSAARVIVEADSRHLRLVVADETHDLPRVKPMNPERVGGNGMRIIEEFSDAWGADLHADDGKEIWFAIDR